MQFSALATASSNPDANHLRLLAVMGFFSLSFATRILLGRAFGPSTPSRRSQDAATRSGKKLTHCGPCRDFGIRISHGMCRRRLLDGDISRRCSLAAFHLTCLTTDTGRPLNIRSTTVGDIHAVAVYLPLFLSIHSPLIYLEA
ncbi:hypothetical protein C8R45DRAFT_418937 [Mycena sanguinolenta]|nr:hypothetical protein C8R45DRAFT_418937 [Mycena sanguinolenta]